MRVYSSPEDSAAFAQTCADAGIGRVILPLHCQADLLKALAKKKIKADFYNCNMGCVEASSRLATLNEAKPCGLAMSPAAFVLAGEMPFLTSWRKGHFVKAIRQLDLCDMTWDGRATALAEGNAEIKELISILRCRNFDGFMVLGGGAVFSGSLMEVRDQLIHLIQEM